MCHPPRGALPLSSDDIATYREAVAVRALPLSSDDIATYREAVAVRALPLSSDDIATHREAVAVRALPRLMEGKCKEKQSELSLDIDGADLEVRLLAGRDGDAEFDGFYRPYAERGCVYHLAFCNSIF